MFDFIKNFYLSHLVPRFAKLRLFYHHWVSLPCYAVFLLLKCILWAIQNVTWRINGIRQFQAKIYRGECYEKSAHVLTVLATCKWSQLDKARDWWHYLTVHHSFQNPDIVLSDHIMLIDVTPTKAVFVQFPRSLDNYNVKNVKFLFIESVFLAVNLIEMPLDSFRKLADRVGDPTLRYDRITFLFGVGRCGSTVVARMLEEADSDDGLVFSEPPTFMEFVYYSKVAERQFYEEQLRNALFLFLKPISNKKRIYVKLTFISTHNAKDIHKILPKAHYVFIHRDSLTVVRSQERAFGLSVMFRSLYWAISSRIFPILEKRYGLRRNPLLEYAYSKLDDSVFEYWMYIYTDLLISYEQQATTFDFPLIVFDELYENPQTFCLNLLKLANLSEFKLTAVLSSLRTDSQEGTVLGQTALRNVPTTECTAALKMRTDKFCEILNLPLLKWNL